MATTLYRKTKLGQDSFASVGSALTQAQRMLLIMIDGKRTLSQLQAAAAVFGDVDALIGELIDLSMIEAVQPINTSPATTPPSSDARNASSNARSNALAQAVVSELALKTVRVNAARFVEQQLGPTSQMLCLRIEKSQSAESLAELLDSARDLLAEVKGKRVADEFEAMVYSKLAR
jgi:hypothetical protein